jgi:chromosome segregation ATPase
MDEEEILQRADEILSKRQQEEKRKKQERKRKLKQEEAERMRQWEEQQRKEHLKEQEKARLKKIEYNKKLHDYLKGKEEFQKRIEAKKAELTVLEKDLYKYNKEFQEVCIHPYEYREKLFVQYHRIGCYEKCTLCEEQISHCDCSGN